ncbi:hypothetical protein [uncultured Rikenella sp.]|uniref:hypothetical protein n=1 Tax=uncultured Rikenella sp. TaxID=368003 RepID=UPI002621F938|nr:hypothetical protein [uncultured Rikenella sp.]
MPSGTAPGYRESIRGALSYVGSGGYWWSSSASDTHSMGVHFDGMWFVPSHTTNRAGGIQLRCLSE